MSLWEWYILRLQVRAILAVAGLFIVSTVTSCNAVRYGMWGKEIDAQVVKVEDVRGRRGRTDRVVTYEFDDAALGKRQEYASVPDSWQPPTPGIVRVSYIPGSAGSSTLPSSSRWIFITIFLLTLTTLTVMSVVFFLNFQKYEKTKAKLSY